MKKLLIIQDCLITGGKHASRGDTVEADERDTYCLIRAGRALDASTREARDVAEEIGKEKQEAADAKAKATKK